MKKISLAVGLVCGLTAGLAQSADLLSSYEAALAGDPVLRAARAERDAALEARPLAKAGLLPAVSFDASTARVRQDTKTSGFGSTGTSYFDDHDASLNLNMPLYRREAWVALRQADSSIAAAEAVYSATQQALVLRVAEGYFNVLSAEDSLSFAKAEKEAISRQLEQAQQRFDVGLIAITPVHEAQAAFDAATARELVAQNDLDTAIEALGEITGEYTADLQCVRDEISLDKPEPADADAWAQSALDGNLNILAAKWGAEAAREGIEQARSGHYPTLDLFASHGYSESGGSFTSRNENSSIGLSLAVPIYTGGAVKASTRQAQASFSQSQEQLESARRSAARQARDAYRGVVSAASQVKAFGQAVVSSQSALQASEAGFEVGTRTIVDVLGSQRDLYAALRDYSASRYNFLLTGLRLRQAVGDLDRKDLEAMNALLVTREQGGFCATRLLKDSAV